jgi:hypothetical protein
VLTAGQALFAEYLVSFRCSWREWFQLDLRDQTAVQSRHKAHPARSAAIELCISAGIPDPDRPHKENDRYLPGVDPLRMLLR